MGIGLDLGAARFRALRRGSRGLVARQTPTAYAAVAASEDHAQLFQRARVSAAQADHAMLVSGPEAELVAMTSHEPLVPMFIEGRLPANDPIARQVAAERVASVWDASEASAGHICTAVLPGDAPRGDATHEFFRQLLSLSGSPPRIITSTQAIALAELGRSGFAGVILSFGATSASLALIERGEIGAMVDVPCGGDWIDRRLAEELRQFTFDRAGHRYLDTVGISRWKLATERSLATTDDPAETGDRVLRQAYVEILTSLLARFRRAVVREGVNGARKQPLTVVCHGGSTRITGFLPLWEQYWNQAEIDLTTSPARLTVDDTWTVARGCLIHSELARDALPRRRTA